jgi:hypothetical protein
MDFAKYKDTDFIPNHYFCKFSLLLDDQEINWQLLIYRYVSILFMEQIEVVVHSKSVKTFYPDDFLRDNSFMLASGYNQEKNYTS